MRKLYSHLKTITQELEHLYFDLIESVFHIGYKTSGQLRTTLFLNK